MSYTADFLIERRKAKWEELHSIEHDKKLRAAFAIEMLDDPMLRAEIQKNPEKLIELFFIVVDKNQQTMPFFLNDVQHDFINTLNKAIEDFKNGEITDISLLVLKGRQQGFTTLVTACFCSAVKLVFAEIDVTGFPLTSLGIIKAPSSNKVVSPLNAAEYSPSLPVNSNA